MFNQGTNKNTSIFMITSRAAPELDGKQVVFGKVIEGMEVVKKIESTELKSFRPVKIVKIKDCGAIN